MSSTEDSAIMPPSHKALIDHFARSLTAFQSSASPLQVLSTLPYTSPSPSPRPPPRQHGVKRLVVMDSSFNPPTRAHAEMLRSALRGARGHDGGAEKGATRVMLLLAVKNADKAPSPAGFPARLGMMEGFGRELIAREEGEGLEVDIAVTTMPYFHDKSLAARSSGFYGAQAVEHVFLAGFDTLIRIFNPKYYEAGIQAALDPFFDGARLRITMRPDDEWGTVEEQMAWVERLRREGEGGIEELGGRREWLERVEMVDGVEGEAVSSSRVREVVRRGRGVEGVGEMVGGEVKAWIEREGLYRE